MERNEMDMRETAREVRLEYWRGIILGQRESGQSIRAYCRAQGINEKSYYYWQRQLREGACAALAARRETGIAFTEIVPQLAAGQNTASSSGANRILIRLGKAEVEIIGEVSQEAVEHVLRTLWAIC